MRLNSEVLRACIHPENAEVFKQLSEDWPGAEEVCLYVERLEGQVLRLKAALEARDIKDPWPRMEKS